MDANTIITVISNIGFPIACAVAIFVYWQKDREANLQALDKLRKTVDNNTAIITRLLEKLEGK